MHIAAALALGLFAQAAGARVMYPTLGVRGNASAGYYGDGGHPTVSFDVEGTGSDLFQDTGLVSSPFNGTFGQVQAWARAGWGSLGVHLWSQAAETARPGGGTYQGTAGGIASAYFIDKASISRPGMDGLSGTVRFSFDVSGAWAAENRYDPSVIGVSMAYNEDLAAVARAIPATGGSATFDIPFVFGQPFWMYFTLTASGGSHSPYNDWAYAYFGSTATLTGMTVYDSLGASVTFYDLSTASGYSYPLAVGADAPEPATWLLAAPVLAIACRRHFRTPLPRRPPQDR
jgi:hypothetical protein